MLNIGTKNQP